MDMDMTNPVTVVRERLNAQQPLDDDGAYSLMMLADRLARLKSQNPAFEAITFSPGLEAMMAEQLTATVN